jgi:hypothetical protein
MRTHRNPSALFNHVHSPLSTTSAGAALHGALRREVSTTQRPPRLWYASRPAWTEAARIPLIRSICSPQRRQRALDARGMMLSGISQPWDDACLHVGHRACRAAALSPHRRNGLYTGTLGGCLAEFEITCRLYHVWACNEFYKPFAAVRKYGILTPFSAAARYQASFTAPEAPVTQQSSLSQMKLA